MLIHEGDMVVCYFKDKGAKLIRVRENGEMNTKHGKLSYSRMIGRPYGATITTSISHPVYLLRPTAEDLAMGVRRISNINYPKDISRILYRIGIRPGARVVEIGAGSGAMAISLAYAVGTEGCVYTYDIREDMLKCTGKNLRRVGLADRVTLKLRDKKEPLSETQVDAVLMDIPTPWEELDASWEALCCAGIWPARCRHTISWANWRFACRKNHLCLWRPWKSCAGRFVRKGGGPGQSLK